MNYPNSPGWKADDTETSRAAATDIDATADVVRRRVHAAYAAVRNATADEIAARLGISILTVRPRCSELKAAGVIEDSGERRPNESGHKAVAWRLVRAVKQSPGELF